MGGPPSYLTVPHRQPGPRAVTRRSSKLTSAGYWLRHCVKLSTPSKRSPDCGTPAPRRRGRSRGRASRRPSESRTSSGSCPGALTDRPAIPALGCGCTELYGRQSRTVRRGLRVSSGAALVYQGSGFLSRKKPPVGPSAGNVATHTTPVALTSTGRAPMFSAPGQVAVNPGADRVDQDVRLRELGSQRARGVQRRLADAVRRCRTAASGETEARILVRAGAAAPLTMRGAELRRSSGSSACVTRQPP